MNYFTILGICACALTVNCATTEEQVKIGVVGEKTYYILESPDLLTWDDAVTACERKGLRLASVENAKENDVLSDFLVKRAPTINRQKQVHVWLGGSDKLSEGQWYWVGPKNTPITYTNWAEHHPQNSSSYNCMYVIPVGDNTKAKWLSHYCENPAAVPVCQST